MNEETLWTRAYGDEYWADVTSPLFFSLLGEYPTEYVNHEGARIMGYREIADRELLRLYKGHICFNTEVLEYVFTVNPKFSRTKELLNYNFAGSWLRQQMDSPRSRRDGYTRFLRRAKDPLTRTLGE